MSAPPTYWHTYDKFIDGTKNHNPANAEWNPHPQSVGTAMIISNMIQRSAGPAKGNWSPPPQSVGTDMILSNMLHRFHGPAKTKCKSLKAMLGTNILSGKSDQECVGTDMTC